MNRSMIAVPGMSEGCIITVEAPDGMIFRGLAGATEIGFRQPFMEHTFFGQQRSDTNEHVWEIHSGGIKELTTTLNVNNGLLIVEQSLWKKMAHWLKRLSWVISSDFDGTEDLRSTNKQLQRFFSELNERGLLDLGREDK